MVVNYNWDNSWSSCGWLSRPWQLRILGMIDDHLGDGGEPSWGLWVNILQMVGDHSWACRWPFWGYWVTILEMVGDYLWEAGWPSLGSGVIIFGMVGYHPQSGWWPSWGWWVTIHGISTGLIFMSYVYVPNSKPVVRFLLVDLGWWVTILWMIGDHPGDGADHPHFTWF